MLTAGQAPRGLAVTTTATQRAQGFGSFIGKGLLSELGFDSGGEERLTWTKRPAGYGSRQADV